ncbi:MAG: hypothetical protein WCE88_09065, partial [Burkholderiales bacterium]
MFLRTLCVRSGRFARALLKFPVKLLIAAVVGAFGLVPVVHAQTYPASLSNTATVTVPAGTTDPTPGNNSATDTNNLAAVANLSAVKTGPATVNSNSTVNYNVVISNVGPSAANGAIFTDVLPANLTAFTNVTCGSPAGGAVCPTVANTTVALMTGAGIVIPTLPNLGSVVFTVTGTAAASGTITNTAKVLTPVGTSDPDDPTRLGAGNNNGQVVTTILVAPTVAKSLLPASIAPGGI